MTDTILCARCQQEKPPLPSPPLGGAAGREVLENTCADCWADWREASARLINHYGLVLGNPEHRAQLRAAMREFLELEDDQDEG